MSDNLNLPMVTVVIPCHNHRQWVNDAIDSVAMQDYPRKQVVVVDDGSSDDSAACVLKRLYKPKRDQNNVYVGKLLHAGLNVMLASYRPAGGPSAARNGGIKLAWNFTDLVGFLDSDDLYKQGKLSMSVAKWLEDPERVGVVYSDYDTLSVTTGLTLRQYKEPFSRGRLTQECIINCDSIVSKKALEVCGFFDEKLRVCEDFDLWMRITEQFVAIHIPESLITIRVGDHSSTSTVQKDTWEANYRRVFEKAQARANAL